MPVPAGALTGSVTITTGSTTLTSNAIFKVLPKVKSFTPAALDKAVEKLLAALKQEASAVKNEADWKAFRDRWMARKNGVLTEINDLWLKTAPKEAKREVGQRVNQLKALVEEALQES